MHFTKNCTPLQLSFKEFNRRCRTTLLKYASRWLLLRTTIIFENIPALDMEKYVLRVMSYQLRVENLKARVEIQKCEFKFTILTWRVTSSNTQVTRLNLRVTSSYPRVIS